MENNKLVSENISITPSGYFGNSIDNIIEINNFLTEEQQQELHSFAKNNKVWDISESKYNENGTMIYDHRVWENRVATKYSILESDPSILSTIDLLIKKLQSEVEQFFNVKARPTSPAVVRWPVGARQEPHADKELHEGPDAGKPNAFPNYDIASLFYFNEDYLGGELYFPLQGIEFKPKAGSAYFFPGDMNYIHGVRPVISGTRYTCPFFWTITKLGNSNE